MSRWLAERTRANRILFEFLRSGLAEKGKSRQILSPFPRSEIVFVSESTAVPKKAGKRISALALAVLAHVLIFFGAALVMVMPAMKEEPEIVAQIITPIHQKEIQPEKKQMPKRARQASSAGAASAIAKMIRSDAVATMVAPEVANRNEGPLGLGEGELGSGFGSGSGSGMGTGASFFGTATTGALAVVFDITGSLYHSVPVVVKEIKKRFSTSQVVCVYGARFTDIGKPEIIPYEKNRKVHAEMKAWLAGDTKGKNAILQKQMHDDLLSLRYCDSLVKGPETLESLGKAIESLLRQPAGRRPDTIFVFSDFEDGVDPKYMETVKKLVKSNHTKVVFYHPKKFEKDKKYYDAFAKETGGEVKEGL